MSYPYKILYDNKGVCSEKSLLLAYLLRGLGYGVVLFEFSSENHVVVGIKSPEQYSYKNSGYAFIESTAPTIPTDSEGDYVGVGKLISTPQIIQVSDGISFSSISEEYNDLQNYNQLYDELLMISNQYGTMLDQYQYNRWVSLHNQWNSLVRKYGIRVSTSSPS
jgi:hypothetical protein